LKRQKGRPSPEAPMEEILSVIRHQLGNSVNAIKITLDVLRENFDLFDEDKKREYLHRGLALVGRQQQLVDAIRAYGALNAEETTEIPFWPFWEHFTNMVKERLTGTNIRLGEKSEGFAGRIIGNRAGLMTALTGILDNAIDAAERMKDPEISLNTKMIKDKLLISIKDNGLGIDKIERKKIFIPLYTTKPGRPGMGLAMARKLVLGMKGSVCVKSLPGKGTEVGVCLNTVGNH
jgi:signal transduction histidine kinase